MIIIPLSQQTFDITALATSVYKCCGQTPESSLKNNQAKALAMLVNAQTKRIDDLSNLRESSKFQKHLHFGFIVVTTMENLYSLATLSSVDVSVFPTSVHDVDLGIVSGTLQQWRTCLINGSDLQELRQILNEIFTYFEKQGLGNVMAPYTKLRNGDGTFSLIRASR